MKAYKGFNKDMTCRGFQFEEGKTYETDEAKLCKSGFHACEMPLNCFNYYAPALSEYHEVELEDVSDEREGDTKVCAKKIKIGAKLDIVGIVKAQFEYVKERCTNNENGGDRSALNGGNWSALNGGDRSALNGGDRSALNGGYGSALNGGDRSALNGGNWSALNGGYGSALNGGDRSALNGGNWSALNGGDRSALNGGNWSALNGGNWSALNGGNGSCLRGGAGAKFKGGMYAVFAAEIWQNGSFIGMKAAIVDGKTIKPDTWYTLENGEFVEVKEK